MNRITTRAASIDDLSSIVEIYNQAIDTKCCTGDLSHFSVDDRIEWFTDRDYNKYPIIVALVDNRTVGYAYLSPYRKGREGMINTVEVSYYVHTDFQRKGIGNLLLNTIISKATDLKYTTLIAILFDSNFASLKLLEKHGFIKWGFLPNVININGNIYSHLYYGLKL